MLKYDPIPWLMAQEGLAAVRARRMVGLDRAGDGKAVRAVARKYARAQLDDGSFSRSPMKTAGALNLLDDLKAGGCEGLIEQGASYLISVLESQAGYDRAGKVRPGGLRRRFDLCGFFGPYEDRSLPKMLAHGAREMNFYRQFEPLLGPKSPVRWRRRSSLDRVGPGSCYAWGLIPLCYLVEALCRAGYARDPRLRPAVNALLGAQRDSGGWCRNLGGHPACTIHAVRALGAHPRLRESKHAEKALELMRSKGGITFALIQAAAPFPLPVARPVLRNGLLGLAPRQRKDGTFGSPCKVERVAAVLVACGALESPSRQTA